MTIGSQQQLVKMPVAKYDADLYRTILNFGDAVESSINKVCIVCEDDAVRNTDMVVWNFYYAGTKSARMNDGRWG